MRHARARISQRADFAHVYMHTMRGDNFGIEKILFFHIRHNGNALRLAHIFHFKSRFCDVNMERHIKFFGEGGRGLQNFWRAGERSVWRNGGGDERVIFPLFDEFARIYEGVFIRGGIGRGEFHYRLPTERTQPGFGGGFGNIVFKIIHIGKSGYAATN